jgi:hypothetical protein
MAGWLHVGRFKARPADGDNQWSVWDTAVNGCRGAGLTRQEANEQAADLELQYDAPGPPLGRQRSAREPPVAVEA